MGKMRRPEQEIDILCEGKTRGLCSSLLELLGLFEKVQRKFHPLMILKHGEALARKAAGLQNAMEEFSPEDREMIRSSCSEPFCCPSGSSSAGNSGFSHRGETESMTKFKGCHACSILLRSSVIVMEAVSRFNVCDDARAGIINAMQAGRKICQARELLFELRFSLREIDDYFREIHGKRRKQEHEIEGVVARGERIIHMAEGQDPYARGIPTIFVPEAPYKKGLLPIVVALHGGFGHGRDFIWTWIREARCRKFFLLAPTSKGSTWSLENTGIDLLPLIDLLKKLAREYPLDLQKVLLTGLSDGATFALQCSQLTDTPFHAFSPVCGVLPPGDLARVRSRRIFWVHGAHDWMFPAIRAHSGCEALAEAGADITLKIVDDLAHAHPSEENATILTWFDPVLFS